MFLWTYIAILCFSAWLFSITGTWLVRLLMRSFVIPRDPNARDNHHGPVPKGGGLAIMIGVAGFLTVSGMNMTIIWSLVLLTAVSFADDLIGISPLKRLIVQFAAATLMVSTLHFPIIPHLMPLKLEFLVVVCLLVWGMNLTNFMDGIDELTCIHTAAVSIGLIALTAMLPTLHNSLGYDSAIMLAAVLGFWFYNRHPASVFMGDSGSIPLGALTTWFLLSLASQGYWVEALILPAYYIVDSGLTMILRLATGHKPWEAHSSHAYQKYVRSGHSHRSTAYIIGLCNLIGVSLAMTCAVKPAQASHYLIAAYAVALVVYLYFLSCPRVAKPNRATVVAHATP